MAIDGQPYAPRSPIEARRAGVAMIYQELSLAPHLTVMENILLGVEPTRFGFLRRGADGGDRDARARASSATAIFVPTRSSAPCPIRCSSSSRSRAPSPSAAACSCSTSRPAASAATTCGVSSRC